MENIHLKVMPTLDSIFELMGIKESDNYDKVSIQNEQESRAISRIIADREFFVIEEGFVGRIAERDNLFLLHEDDMFNESEYDKPLEGDLVKGKYQFDSRESTILIINMDFKIQEEPQEISIKTYPEYEEEQENDSIVDQIFNLITDSAKKKFDYKSFAKDLADFDPDYILFQIIAFLANNESVDLIISKITVRIFGMGYMLDEESLK